MSTTKAGDELPPLLSLPEAARILNPKGNPRSLAVAVRRGTCPLPEAAFVKYGTRLKVRTAVLLRFLEGDAA